MNEFGGILALMGVASAVLSFTTYELRLLFWIENWGDNVAWAIRIGLVVVGCVLLFAAASQQPQQQRVAR